MRSPIALYGVDHLESGILICNGQTCLLVYNLTNHRTSWRSESHVHVDNFKRFCTSLGTPLTVIRLSCMTYLACDAIIGSIIQLCL